MAGKAAASDQQSGLSPDPRIPRTRIKAGALLAAVKDVTGVVAGRSTIPILEFVWLSAIDGAIALCATDLDMWATRSLASDDAGQADSADWQRGCRNFTITLPGKALEALLGQIDSAAMVTLTAPHGDETRATIAAGRARFRLNCLPPEDFPLAPPAGLESTAAGAQFEIAASALADLFASVEHAISTEETRYYLNGIYLHPEGLALRAAATDGHRLARLSIDAPDGAASFAPTILPRGAVAVLDKLLAAAAKSSPDALVTVRAEGTLGSAGQAARLRFAMPAADDGEVELVTKSIDGSFPDYTRVIPDSPEVTVRIDRAGLIEAVKRVSVLAESKTRVVRCLLEPDKLTVSVVRPDLGDGQEELACDYDGAGLTLGLDSTYLLAALRALACDTVALGLSGPAGPVRLRAVEGDDRSESERLVQVVMPSRV